MKKSWNTTIMVSLLMLGTACAAPQKVPIDTLSSASVREAHEGTTSQEMVQLYEELNALKVQLEQYESALAAEKNQFSALQESAKHLLEALDEEKLKEIAQLEWHYALRVNGEAVGDMDRLVIKPGDVMISLSERFQDPSVLPAQLLASGRISADYRSHLTVTTKEPYELQGRDGTVVTTQEYVFKNLQPGSIIVLELSDELSERLATTKRTFTIEVQQ